MVCYKMPKLKVIEVGYAVFELGIERLKIHSLSAIFILNQKSPSKAKSKFASKTCKLLFFLYSCSDLCGKSARARDFLRGLPAADADRLTAPAGARVESLAKYNDFRDRRLIIFCSNEQKT